MENRVLLAAFLCQAVWPQTASTVSTPTPSHRIVSIQHESNILNRDDLRSGTSSRTPVLMKEGFGALPLSFEANQGQADTRDPQQALRAHFSCA